MAITELTPGAAKTVASGNLASVAVPTGTAADTVLVSVLVTADNVVSTFPVGWAKKLELNAGTFLRVTVAWIRLTGAGAAYTITHTGGNGGVARTFGFTGVVTSGDPFEDAQLQANLGTLTITAPNLPLATTANNLILLAAGIAISGSTSNTFAVASYSGTDPAFVEKQDSGSVLGSNHVHEAVATGIRTAASAPGSRTAAITTAYTAASVNNIGALLALKEATGTTAVSGSDSATGTDATSSLSVTAPGADTSTGSDAGTVSATASSSDASTGTDAATVAATVPGSDTATGTDTGGSPSVTGSGSETGSGADAGAVSATVSGSDSATGTDDGTVVDTTGGATVLSDSDSGTGTDDGTVVDLTPPVVEEEDLGDISSIVGIPPRFLRGHDMGFGSESGTVVDLTPRERTRLVLPLPRRTHKFAGSDTARAEEAATLGVTARNTDSGQLVKESSFVEVIDDPRGDAEDAEVLMMLNVLSDL